MSNVVPISIPTLNAEGWRISLKSALEEDEVPLVTVTEPCRRFAVAQELNVCEVLETPALENDDSLLLIWIPRTAAVSPEWENQIEMWPGVDPGSRPLIVRGGIRTARVVWSPNRAVICGDAEELKDAKDAVIRFTLAARKTLDLQDQLANIWPEIEKHKSLTHAVSRRQLRFQSEVNGMTERVTEMKANHLSLQRTIKQLDSRLTTTSKLLFSELAFQAGLFERLEMLENPIQFGVDHFELSNTRLIEARFQRTEFILLITIAVLVLADFVVLFIELSRYGAWQNWIASITGYV